MTPYELARKVYESEPCARLFEEDLVAHFHSGTVISTPEIFMMFRPVCSGWKEEDILDPWLSCPEEVADCWHIWMTAGDVAQARDYIPFPLPLASFERKNVLRLVRFHKIAEKLQRYGKSRRTTFFPRSDWP